MITFSDIEAAAARLDGVAARTPVLRSRTLGAGIRLKAECFQRAGAFKFRGAYNAISSMPEDERTGGVCAVSSGNHAQAVALAARELGARAVILMPADAPSTKLAATRSYGAEVVTFDRYSDDRDALLRGLARARGLAAVHPYDDERVMAGAGTVALELLRAEPDLECLVVPCGGGGLISGCAVAAAALAPDCRVVGVEPAAGDDTRRSLAAGERVAVAVPRTIADGLAVPIPGELTFPHVRAHVEEIVTVTDDELRGAMRFAFERLKLVLEPSAAAGLAAVLSDRIPDARTGIVLTGGNVGTARFCELLA